MAAATDSRGGSVLRVGLQVRPRVSRGTAYLYYLLPPDCWPTGTYWGELRFTAFQLGKRQLARRSAAPDYEMGLESIHFLPVEAGDACSLSLRVLVEVGGRAWAQERFSATFQFTGDNSLADVEAKGLEVVAFPEPSSLLALRLALERCRTLTFSERVFGAWNSFCGPCEPISSMACRNSMLAQKTRQKTSRRLLRSWAVQPLHTCAVLSSPSQPISAMRCS